jgi:hypothetical protein
MAKQAACQAVKGAYRAGQVGFDYDTSGGRRRAVGRAERRRRKRCVPIQNCGGFEGEVALPSGRQMRAGTRGTEERAMSRAGDMEKRCEECVGARHRAHCFRVVGESDSFVLLEDTLIRGTRIRRESGWWQTWKYT